MKQSQRPTVDQVGSEGSIYRHPAYAVVRVTNPQGSRSLFGSDIEHNEFIQLEIAPAYLKRGLNSDWIHGESRPIVSIAMSHAQFVSMIQSSGKYEGTPCTLQYAPSDLNKSLVAVPSIELIQTKTDLIKEEIQRDARKAIEIAEKAIQCVEKKYLELKDGKSVTKKDLYKLEPLINLAKSKIGNLPSNLSFALSCAEETIDKAVHDAKIEIEASVEHKLRQVGLEAMRDDQGVDLSLLLNTANLDQQDKQ